MGRYACGFAVACVPDTWLRKMVVLLFEYDTTNPLSFRNDYIYGF